MISSKAKDMTQTTDLSDFDLRRLIAALDAPKWKFLLQLLAAFGTRPVGAAYSSASGSQVYCTY